MTTHNGRRVKLVPNRALTKIFLTPLETKSGFANSFVTTKRWRSGA
jgi:hypothetical protein